jgi:hypothetical protein
MQRLVVEDAHDRARLHVVDETRALPDVREAQVVQVTDVLAAIGNHWYLDAVLMFRCTVSRWWLIQERMETALEG